MSTGILSIGITGLNAAQLSLLTTEHNITNSSTPGYNRQRIGQTTGIAIATGAGYVGQGTTVNTITRVYNSFLQNQVNQSQTSYSELDTYYSQIKQIDNLLADSNAGLTPALQAFFTGVQEVASSPSSTSARQSMTSAAQTLAARINSLSNQFTSLYNGVNSQLKSTTDEINSYATQIGALNQRIVVAQATAGQPPNDLMDQRDQLIAELNKDIRVSTVTESDGSLSVFIGSGQQLVVGANASTIDARPSVADPERYTIGLITGSGAAYQELPENLITGGSLSGFLRFRSESLDPAANSLGAVAASLAITVNAQQSLGQDLLGQTVNTAAPSSFATQIFQFGSNNVPKIVPNALNTGTGAITATLATTPGQTNGYAAPSSSSTNFYTNLTNSDYKVTFGAGGTYQVTRLTDKTVVASGTGTGTVGFDGVSINITATGANGDSFTIQPTREVAKNFTVNAAVAADPRLIAAAAPIRTAVGVNSVSGQANSGTATISAGSVSTGYTTPAGTITLTYNSATQQFSGFPSGANPRPYTATGTTYSFNGLSFDINGTPANGDTFTIQANTSGVSDGRNVVLMGKLQTQNTMYGDSATGTAGTSSFQQAYSQLVSAVGNKAREVKTTADAQASLLEQAQSARDSQSGVNLDEEAANLLKYQYAYQASAKMIQVGSKLFDTILSIGA